MSAATGVARGTAVQSDLANHMALRSSPYDPHSSSTNLGILASGHCGPLLLNMSAIPPVLTTILSFYQDGHLGAVVDARTRCKVAKDPDCLD